MKDLEVGMYVRTEYGISKIVNIFFEKTGTFIETDNGLGNCTMSTRGKLHKGIYILEEDYKTFIDNNVKNTIIDLIEVGDYVNGCYVSNKRASVNEHLGGHPKGIGIIKCNAYFNQVNYNDCKFEWIEEKDIKSIVTKEQFESCMYKVKD